MFSISYTSWNMVIVTIHITRARAQHEKCSQKHGGLRPLLTPEWRHMVIGIIWESQSCIGSIPARNVVAFFETVSG